MITKAVILAGGKGIRMLPLTNYIPKALIKVNNLPLIWGVMNFLKIHGVNDIAVTYGYLSEVLFENISNQVSTFINTNGQDNAWFLFNSYIKNLNEPILVIPCDISVEVDINTLSIDYEKLGSPAIMLVGTKPIEDVAGDYITFNDYNEVDTLDRYTPTHRYCSGIQIINPKKINELCEEAHNFYDVWGQLLGSKNLKVSNFIPKSWMAYDNIKQII